MFQWVLVSLPKSTVILKLLNRFVVRDRRALFLNLEWLNGEEPVTGKIRWNWLIMRQEFLCPDIPSYKLIYFFVILIFYVLMNWLFQCILVSVCIQMLLCRNLLDELGQYFNISSFFLLIMMFTRRAGGPLLNAVLC